MCKMELDKNLVSRWLRKNVLIKLYQESRHTLLHTFVAQKKKKICNKFFAFPTKEKNGWLKMLRSINISCCVKYQDSHNQNSCCCTCQSIRTWLTCNIQNLIWSRQISYLTFVSNDLWEMKLFLWRIINKMVFYLKFKFLLIVHMI